MKKDKDHLDMASPHEIDFTGGDGVNDEEKQELIFLARMLREMPDREPPFDLAESVVQSVQPKKIPIWRRLYLWARTPQSITFSPIKLIPAAAMVVAVAITVLFWPAEQNLVSLDQREQRVVPVKFTLNYPQARSVSLIGSFNQWKPKGFEMREGGGKLWVVELELPEGRHEYAFLVDGEAVMADPGSPFSEHDGFGNRNSIVYVKNENGRTI